MQVCATGWPIPTIKWFKNGEEIKSEGPDGRRTIWTDERGIHHCVIINVQPEDEGGYSLTATNPLGEAKTEEIKSEGPDGRRTIWTDERGIHHCVIINVQPEDEGDYSLTATNPLGEAKTEGPLSVIRPRHPVEGSELDKYGGMPFPPGFIRQLKNKHVFTHMPTIFDFEWYHNGKKIVPDGRTKIQVAGGGSHALIILDSTLEDCGEYVAIAKNSHGTAQSSAILDVTVPHLDNIKFDGTIDVTPYLTEEYGFKKINFKCLPTPPDRGPFIKEVTGHYLTLSWIPTKRTPPRYPQVTYVIEIRELPERDWTMLDYNIPEPVCKVRNLELGK
uniref:Immunoglobulin I-set domain protein n=1 Tax=Panagrolaimus sp. ES5 TaxID=591445 RepID=A0AC34G427_9BILA